jgi:hypothetical protein
MPDNRSRRRSSKRPLPEGDAKTRILQNDIAEELSKNWRFKLQVIGISIISLFSAASVLFGILGWGFYGFLKDQNEVLKKNAYQEIAQTKKAVEDEIKAQLQTKSVTEIINKSASEQAKLIINNALNPSISEFQSKFDKSSVDLNDKISQTSKAAEESLHKFDVQLKLLTTRNEITALADRAISDGDIEAYRKLNKLASSSDSSISSPATTELFAVFDAYSIFSPSRIKNIKYDAKLFNPQKTKQEDLSLEDIMPQWEHLKQPLGRAKLAQLMSAKVRRGSYSTAKFLAEAIKAETHLEVLRYLGVAFQRVTGHKEGGGLDQRELLEWWERNETNFKKTDTDPKLIPSPTPIRTLPQGERSNRSQSHESPSKS